MNRLYFTLFALMFLPYAAEGQENNIYEISGAANLEFCEKLIHESVNWREGYCFGVIDATTSILNAYGTVCLPKSSSFGQDVRVVVAYMERHPELLHKPLTELAVGALREAFPCYGTRGLAK